jgi:hypothetical protein
MAKCGIKPGPDLNWLVCGGVYPVWFYKNLREKNVFITDGACMVSTACQNPSLTYMALTARAVDFAVSELKKQIFKLLDDTSICLR